MHLRNLIHQGWLPAEYGSRHLHLQKKDTSIALSDPQNRTARRVGSYDRLWFGKSITSSKRCPAIGNHPDFSRDWLIESALQCSFRRVNNAGADLPKRFHTFGPLPLNAAMDAQRIYGTHQGNPADTPT